MTETTITAIPSLTEEGWVTDSLAKLAFIMSYYILTDIAQTIAFQGNIISLPYTYYRYINEPSKMAHTVKQDLENLLNRYFPIVDVIVKAKEKTKKEYAILIYAAVIDNNGKKYDLTRVAEVNTEGYRRIISMNNYGDGEAYLE